MIIRTYLIKIVQTIKPRIMRTSFLLVIIVFTISCVSLVVYITDTPKPEYNNEKSPTVDSSLLIDRKIETVSPNIANNDQIVTPPTRVVPPKETYAPGGVYVTKPHQVGSIRLVANKSQKFPEVSNATSSIFLVKDSPTYTIHIIVENETPVVDVFLKQPPFYDSRAEAESEFAKKFGGERADLCGFPFFVHVPEDSHLYKRGNLGLEHCGANQLAENE